jgi:hypothetical protein
MHGCARRLSRDQAEGKAAAHPKVFLKRGSGVPSEALTTPALLSQRERRENSKEHLLSLSSLMSLPSFYLLFSHVGPALAVASCAQIRTAI